MYTVLLPSKTVLLTQVQKMVTIVFGCVATTLYFLSPFQSHFFIAATLTCLVCSGISLLCSFVIEVNPCYKFTDIAYHAAAASTLVIFSVLYIVGVTKMSRGDLTDSNNNIFGPSIPPMVQSIYGDRVPDEAKVVGILGVVNGLLYGVLVGVIALT